MSLAVKSGRPPSRDGLIVRSRLLERMHGGRDLPLALIVAPAGYGKTSLVAQWTGQDERPSVWIALEGRHSEPRVLAAELLRALDEIEPVDRDLIDELDSNDFAGAAGDIALSLSEALEGRTLTVTIVLDDVHAIDGAPSLALLGDMAEHLSPGSQLVLSSRTRPPLAVGRLRAHRALLELDVADLAMTVSEASALMRTIGIEPSSADAATAVERTEGWPAGLYLAALSCREADDASAALNSFTGDDHVVAEYVADEFLSVLSDEDLDLIVSSSVVERLSGPLCDTLLGRSGSSQALDRLAKQGLPLVPIDRTHDTYRAHRLLRETLLAELRREDPQREIELHLRAGEWHVQHGQPSDAVDQALAAGDDGRAGELLWACLPSVLDDAARACELAPVDSPWRAICCVLHGVADQLAGERAAARERLEESVRRSGVSAPMVEMLCLSQLALLTADEGDLERGVELIERACARVQRHALGATPTSALMFAVSADLLTREGRMDEAKREVRRAGELLVELGDFIAWYGVEVRIALARALLRLGDTSAARALLAQASRLARRVPEAPVFREWLDDAWGLADAAAASALAGSSALTIAELRILRFLPTHLSLREIGALLHVSTNTVKTQAHAVYRKLEVSSRSQAVERAREIGLIQR